MPQYKSRSTKPGAEKAPFRPDVIESFIPQESCKLLEFLIQSMPQRKRTTIKELLKHNQIAVNGIPVTQFDAELNPGDKVQANLTREFRVFSHRRVKIDYEDDDIIVIEKGYGLLSMGTDKIKDGTAYSILRDYVKWVDPRNKLFIVHRLDRDTSGLMMFAKNSKAKEAMQHNWNNMVLNRKYVTVVEGNVEQDSGVVKSYLVENSQMEVYSSQEPVEGGEWAVTRYKVLKRGNGHTMLEVELDTGRKNQIRVHMKDLGHPIAGDRKYGARASIIHRLALHAQTLRFAHPVTRRDMNFTTPIPGSFFKLIGGKR
ncbi:MAG: RluA family pseudouridine synthase [Lachnospiraceae bacterium]|nr:RluA family pseudouridine synthase [Lachnospiraceae bacterium]